MIVTPFSSPAYTFFFPFYDRQKTSEYSVNRKKMNGRRWWSAKIIQGGRKKERKGKGTVKLTLRDAPKRKNKRISRFGPSRG